MPGVSTNQCPSSSVVEREPEELSVGGSIPSSGTIMPAGQLTLGLVADQQFLPVAWCYAALQETQTW